MAVCPQCGSNNADTSATCWKCYASLSGVSPGAAAPSAAASPQRATTAPRPAVSSRRKSKSSPMPVIVVLLLLAAGGAGAYYWLVIRPGDPAEIATEFVKAQLEFDFAKAKQLATSSSASTLDSRAQAFAQIPQLSQLKSLVRLEKAEPGTVSVSGGEAQVPVNTRISGQDLTLTVTLTRESGAWKVDLAKTDQANTALAQQMMQQLFQQGGGFMLPGLPGMGTQ